MQAPARLQARIVKKLNRFREADARVVQSRLKRVGPGGPGGWAFVWPEVRGRARCRSGMFEAARRAKRHASLTLEQEAAQQPRA